jgi:hypothetical protein
MPGRPGLTGAADRDGSDVQERLGDVLGSAPGPGADPRSDDEAFQQVRDRIQALISAARTLSDTCADLADALRPVPGMAADDPVVAGYGRLRAERTAALLDEAASAARGTLGLLHSAYGALADRMGSERSGAGTWPDAFVEVSRAFTVEEEAGTAVQRPWARPRSGSADATDPHGVPLIPAAAPGGSAAADIEGGGAEERADGTSSVPPAIGGQTLEGGDEASGLGNKARSQDVEDPLDESTGDHARPDGEEAAEEPAVEDRRTPAVEHHADPAVEHHADPAVEHHAGPAVEGEDAAAVERGRRPEGARVAGDFEVGPLGASEAPLGAGVAPGPPIGTTPVGYEPDVDESDIGPDAIDGEGLRGWADPARARMAVDLTAAELRPADPGDAEHGAADVAAAGASDADQRSVEPGDAEHGAADVAAAGASDADQRSVEPGDADHGAADVAAAGASDADQRSVEPGDADHGAADLSAAGGSDSDLRPADPGDAQHGAGSGSDADLLVGEQGAAGLSEAGLEATEQDPSVVDPTGPELGAAEGSATERSADGRSVTGGDGVEEAEIVGEHTRDDIVVQGESGSRVEPVDDGQTAEDVDGEGLRGWASGASPGRTEIAAAALAGWMVVDPDDADDPGHPIRERTVAAAPSVERLTVPVDDADGPSWHGDSVSAEPRSLSLVPPVADEPTFPAVDEGEMPAGVDLAAEPAGEFADNDFSGASAFARVDRPVWTPEPDPESPAVFPIASAPPATAPAEAASAATSPSASAPPAAAPTTPPFAVGPSAIGPSSVDPSTGGASTSGPSTTGPSTTGPSTTGPSTIDPSGVGSSGVGPSTARPPAMGPSTGGPSTMDPLSVGPSGGGPAADYSSAAAPADAPRPAPTDPFTSAPPAPAGSTLAPPAVGSSTLDALTVGPSPVDPSTAGASAVDPSAEAPADTDPAARGPFAPDPTPSKPSGVSSSSVGPSTAYPLAASSFSSNPSAWAEPGADRYTAGPSVSDPLASAAGPFREDPLDSGAGAAVEKPLEEPEAAVLARQVEAARRHLQAALVVANGPGAPRRLGALLTGIEQVLTAVTDLARETRGLLESGLADRTFPGEARFLCSPPWEGTSLVGRDAYGDDAATPAGLAKLLRALGYEAHSATSAGGAASVQIRGPRYSMQVALVEPAGGGRQRWSGALEWEDESGANRTWAETIGPVELEDEELARRVDELLRRSVG